MKYGFIIAILLAGICLSGCGSTIAGETIIEESETPTTAVAEIDDVVSEELSPSFLWKYDGYVDEAMGYSFREDFVDKDYDGDGKTDRLYRISDSDNDKAKYKIEFGNGNSIETPSCHITGFPHIQTGDLDKDGEEEILFTVTFDAYSDPYVSCEIWLFDFDDATNEYREADLPLTVGEYGGKGLTIDYEAPVKSSIGFTAKENNYKAVTEVPEEVIDNWWEQDAVTEVRPVWYAVISDST
ncbi:hypothetical protein [Butyrivibrio sp. INlla16]|uniref:hypothetical protein n=1 Tax=Butyrivibrio sp. INlla16 TaxID=1520807 RepID=UPI00087E2D09|nr:hypothetical protein [Butyrivibrio sp. INlla16]SDB50663.1 hypothetical protein SAMN02910263_02535 [Butyrivibrio sp. INlla16]